METRPIILVVDDDRAWLHAVRRAFLQSPWKFLFAQSGEEALDVLSQHNIQVMVTDMYMHGMTGVELLKYVRERFPDIHRILLSGYPNPSPGDVSDMVKAVYRGDAASFIVKGADMTQTLEGMLELAFEQMKA